ncbi:MAG: efflux RND transporter permease subunit [Patescibacteria group bacterium]
MNEKDFKNNTTDRLDKAWKKEEKSIIGFFINNFRLSYLILLTLIIIGAYSIFTIPREANPEVKVPYALVTAVLPGATPVDTELLITNKIEEKIKNLPDLNHYTSSSGQGISSIFVEFNADANLTESLRNLQQAVEDAKPILPSEANAPVVMEINFSDIPIVTYSLVNNLTDVELKKYADILKDNFEDISNVSKVVIIGGLEREFKVIINQTKLNSYNLSLGQIINAIAATNFNLPAGSIEIDGFNYNVRVQGKFTDPAVLSDIVVATYNNAPVYIRDLGQVIDGFKEKNTESLIGFKDQAPSDTISLQIYKKTGGNILNIVDDSQAVISSLQSNGDIPSEIKIVKTNDNSVFIREDLSRLGKNGLQTMVLITIILLVVLSIRGAIITALSVPIAFLMAFIFLKFSGQTLNSLVLFSLVLSLGLMVDNSIVIIEGITEYMAKHGKSAYQAALLSVWNFKWPITSGTMTTVSAFLPILLVSGILGEFLKVMPITITVTLLSSLFVALIIIPTLVSRFFPAGISSRKRSNNKINHYRVKILNNLKTKYINFLRYFLPNKKRRRVFIGLVWLVFFISVAVPVFGLMEIQMFPDVDVNYFVINIKLPAGSTLEKTKLVAEEVEKVVASLPEVDNYVTNLGSSGSTDFISSGSGGSHLGSITVNLVDKNLRNRKSYEITESVRSDLDTIQGAEVTAEELSAGPPSGAPIEVRLTGDELDKLESYAGQIVGYFKGIPGVINAKDSVEESTGDFTFTIDQQRANYYGLTVTNIALILRNAIYGAKASTVTINGADIDITVKYNKEFFNNVNDLKNILITTPSGVSLTLNEIASLNLEPSFLSISHRDGQRIVTITADTEKGVDLRKVFADFTNYQASLSLSDGYSINIGGELEDIQRSYQETFLSMILAVILIAFILVLQFNSFRQPLIIIFTLPLAIIGVLFGLNVLRLPFSFTAFIGIVALAGIVVNDAIILIDQINKNLKNGMEFYEGIISGGLARIQPIFLTSITTIAGIFPLVFADELWRGLSVTVISGLVFSTVLTLLMIPIVYAGLCKKEKCFDIEQTVNKEE